MSHPIVGLIIFESEVVEETRIQRPAQVFETTPSRTVRSKWVRPAIPVRCVIVIAKRNGTLAGRRTVPCAPARKEFFGHRTAAHRYKGRRGTRTQLIEPIVG